MQLLCFCLTLCRPVRRVQLCHGQVFNAFGIPQLLALNFSRWPDHSSLWLLLPCCLCSALLWACLCAEAAHSLVVQSGAKCVEPVPPLGLSWLEQERLEKLRPCLGPALHSLLLCVGLIGGFDGFWKMFNFYEFSSVFVLMLLADLLPRIAAIHQ